LTGIWSSQATKPICQNQLNMSSVMDFIAIKWVDDGVTALGLDAIGKLRCDVDEAGARKRCCSLAR
jgi:hypothetical protein